MKNITNTLSRWHKIAERIKVAAQEVRNEINSDVDAAHIDFDEFTVRRESLKAKVDEALGKRTALYLSLQEALFTVRRDLSRANVECGVSDLLNQQEHAKQKQSFYADLLSCGDRALQVDEFVEMGDKRAKSQGAAGMFSATTMFHSGDGSGMRSKVSFVAPETSHALTDKRNAARIELNNLSDKLADANATKITVGLPDDVCAYLGL